MIFRQEKHPSKRRQQVHRYYVIIAAAKKSFTVWPARILRRKRNGLSGCAWRQQRPAIRKA